MNNFEQPVESRDEIFFTNERESSAIRRNVAIGAGVVGTAASVYLANKLQMIPDNLLDMQIIPQPPVYDEIVDGMVATNTAIREVAPIAGIGAIGYGTVRLASRKFGKDTGRKAAMDELSTIDYSGIETLMAKETGERANRTFLDKIKARKNKAITTGVKLAFAATAIIGVSSGLEHEISNGPNRPVDKIIDAVTGEDNAQIVLQAENNTFMDSSYVDADGAMEFVKEAEAAGITAVPFSKELPNIDGKSGLVLTFPDEFFEKFAGVELERGCSNAVAVSDEANSTQIGREISVNGETVEVVGKIQDAAQMNRDVAIMPQSQYETCVRGIEESSEVFGVIIGGNDSVGREVFNESELSEEAALITEEVFRGNNREFWQKNGLPIVLQLMIYSGAFAAGAITEERLSSMRRNTQEIGILNAQGVSMSTIKAIERRRALRETAFAAAMAAPVMPVMAAVFNAAEFGLKAGVGLREVLVGYSLTLGAKLWGGQRAGKKFDKDLDLSKAVRG